MKLKTILLITLLSIILLSACSKQESMTKEDILNAELPHDHEDGTHSHDDDMNDMMQDHMDNPITGNVVEIDVTAKNWEFIPNEIKVNKGDNVILNVKSIDVNHGMSIPEFGISEFLEPGKTVIIDFIASKEGTFSFFCNVACGRGHGGMRGTLIVE